jgi:hypothetical protein
MTQENIIHVKYVFLDVVAYTKRTVEAQCYVIKAINRIIKGTINKYRISDDSIILLPTGDGMCIALLGVSPYDIHIRMAKEILRRIYVNNSRIQDNSRQFEIRIGINQGDDNIVTDVNGRKNVTGAAINNTRRIMDLADARQILVSNIVYENLHPRKAYNNSFSQEFTYQVKHGLVLKMYQLIEPEANWLDIQMPSIFTVRSKPEPKLTELAAYYFAHSIKNKKFLIDNRDVGMNIYALRLLLRYLAVDSLGYSKSTYIEPYDSHMPDTNSKTLNDQFEVFMELPFWICCDLSDLICHEIGEHNYKYFEDGWDFTIVNEAGQNKLKSEWPDIWDEFGLDKLLNII